MSIHSFTTQNVVVVYNNNKDEYKQPNLTVSKHATIHCQISCIFRETSTCFFTSSSNVEMFNEPDDY